MKPILALLLALALPAHAQTFGQTGSQPQLKQVGPMNFIRFPDCPPGFYNIHAKPNSFICEIKVLDGTTQGQAIGARYVHCDPTDYWNRHSLSGFKKNGIPHYHWRCGHQG